MPEGTDIPFLRKGRSDWRLKVGCSFGAELVWPVLRVFVEESTWAVSNGVIRGCVGDSKLQSSKE